LLSIVVPTFNSEKHVPGLYTCMKKALDTVTKPYEVIFVDDGSVDGTVDILKELHRKEKNIRIVKLRRNFGQHTAIFVGICKAKGDVIMMMDVDLRYDPADIPIFLEKIGQGYDFISGWRVDRNDPFLSRKVPSSMINALFFYLFRVKLHDFACSFKCFGKNVAAEMINDGTVDRIPSKLGRFSYTEVKLNHSPKKSGPSTYTLFKLIKVAVEIFSGFILGKLNIRKKKVDPSRLVEEAWD
jgi:glycosyltransferase involved in cell wall biosynthesis